MTLNELIELIKLFGEDHQQVNTVYFGTRNQVDAGETSYGTVQWIYLSSASILDTMHTVSFEVAFMDVLNNDLGNLEDVYSDTMRVCEDFVAYMEDASYDYGTFQVKRDGTINPFIHSDTSDYAGWVVNFTINYAQTYDACDMSMDTCLIDELTDWLVDELGNRIIA